MKKKYLLLSVFSAFCLEACSFFESSSINKESSFSSLERSSSEESPSLSSSSEQSSEETLSSISSHSSEEDSSSFEESSSNIESSVVSSSKEESSSISLSSSEEENPDNGIQKYLTLCHGSYSRDETEIKASVSNSIGLVKNKTMDKGTLSASVTCNSKSDNGIIFGVNRGTLKTFWESNVSYYFFFISQSGSCYLGKISNGSWSLCNEKSIEGFNETKTYDISVSFDLTNQDNNIINCFLGEDFLFSYKDKEKVFGTEYGVRFGAKNAKISYLIRSSEFKEEVLAMVGDFYLASGKFSYSNNSYRNTDTINSSLLYKKDSFVAGSFSVSMKQGGAGCNGIIFNLNNDDQSSFFEQEASYYYFFISEIGYARLSKVNFGSWSDISVSDNQIENWSTSSKHALKVVLDGEKIECYIDNQKVIETFDENPLTGEYYGLRSQVGGTKYTDISVNKENKAIYSNPTSYDVIKGKFLTKNEDVFISKESNSIALNKTESFEEGTLTFTLNENNAGKTGVIFRSNEEASSYFHFFIRENFAKFVKIENGEETYSSSEKFITASHKKGSTETIQISISENKIRCYIRGILYVVYEDLNMLNGQKYGFSAELCGSSFAKPVYETTPLHKTAETLIIGHSYMELWTNYATDLSKLNDVYDIGIGGSNAEQWKLMENEICDYEPTTIIYMIGINDLFLDVFTAQQVVDNVKTLVSNLKTKITTLENIVLVSVNKVVNTVIYLPSSVDALNTKYQELCNDPEFSSYLLYANNDSSFLNSGNVDPTYFVDGLHPTALGYILIRNAIYDALGVSHD